MKRLFASVVVASTLLASPALAVSIDDYIKWGSNFSYPWWLAEKAANDNQPKR